VFHFLANGQGTIAAQLGVVYRGRYCLLKTAHDEALRNLAPGHLITLHALNDCAARGLLVYDFIAKDDEWKLKWTQDLLVH
jgi:CelD/BcsL family acetyltransferase involved in cellulose biosynthesis